MKNLVIVESPSKAKTINKYLGNGYKVISSLGHIMDLPKNKIGIDIENNYLPIYEVIKGKDELIRLIREEAKNSSKVILATDPDREGEAISWHLSNLIKNENPNIERIVFHEITKEAIINALKHPRDIDQNLFNAQQARRILDRLVGYSLSPFLWKKIKYGLSAGRVQSVALRLIVDREIERRNFIPQEYWNLFISLSDSEKKIKVNLINSSDGDIANNHNFLLFNLKSINSKKVNINNKDDLNRVIESVKNAGIIKVKSCSVSKMLKNPNPPFTTSTFQQACVNNLGISSNKAMKIAQKLYENGLITYMRTDSINLSDVALKEIRKVISNNFGNDYLPEKAIVYKNKSRNAQEAHEAIRPTNFKVIDIGSGYTDQEKKVYNLIYQRTIASQMKPAEFNYFNVLAELVNQGDKYEFTSGIQQQIFDGWMKIYNKSDKNKKDELLNLLSQLKEGDILFINEIYGVQYFTKPPARFTEASLIKALDKYSIGRPSTYASIVNIIMERDYVLKDGKYFYPTEIGEIVVRLLKDHFSEIVDIDFTANMEDSLDKIAVGDLDWVPFIDNFYKPFKSKLDLKEKELKKEDYVIIGQSDELCDLCKKPMVKRLGKYGIFLSCVDYPNCKGIKKLQSQIDVIEKSIDLSFYEEPPKTQDNRSYILKKSKYGYFWAHPDYPKVKDIKQLELKQEKIVELFGPPPLASDGKTMILKKGKYGYFWAHPDYPKVKEILRVKSKIKLI